VFALKIIDLQKNTRSVLARFGIVFSVKTIKVVHNEHGEINMIVQTYFEIRMKNGACGKYTVFPPTTP